jgi:hypothetical protein
MIKYMAKSYFSKIGNILDTKNSSSLLYNKYVLYFVFLIALLDIFYFIQLEDYTFSSIFVIIGFLTSFFSKNMIVILCIAMAVTNILKYGVGEYRVEGFDDEPEPEFERENTDTDTGPMHTKVVMDNSGNKVTSGVIKDPGSTDVIVPNSNPTEEARNAEKSGFKGKDGVYTAEEDKSVKRVYSPEQLIENQKKLMKKLDKYKPLLDTMNNISKTLSIYKGGNEEKPL